MHRTFHSKVDGAYWLLMGATACLLFGFFWYHYVLAAVCFALVMILEIEMLVHTRYVVTSDGFLLVESGRFLPKAKLELDHIVGMSRVKSFGVAPALSAWRVEIVYRSGEVTSKVQISPKEASEFIRWVEKKKKGKEETNVQ